MGELWEDFTSEQGADQAAFVGRKSRLTDQIQRLDEWGLEEPESWAVGELSAYDQHPADSGSETFAREQDLAMRDHARNQLQKVEEALSNLDSGNYGICEACGQGIDESRLEAIPYTTLCYDGKVAEEANTQELREARPAEEEALPAGYSFRDDRDEFAGFDGEDTWQALAGYGTANSPQDVSGELDYEDLDNDDDEDGVADPMDRLVDLRGDGASDLDEIYPDPEDPAFITER